MKAIGNIFVTWRPQQGVRRIAIGVIKRNSNNGVTFTYLSDNLKQAQENGFSVLQSFPDPLKVYNNNVIEKFGERIVKSERTDNQQFYDFWKIDVSMLNDKYYMLAMSQGLLATDNLEFLADFNPRKENKFISDIAAISKYKCDLKTISIGTKLDFKLESKNANDSKAVILLINGTTIGYMKQFHSNSIHKAVKSKIKPSILIKKIIDNEKTKKVFIEISF